MQKKMKIDVPTKLPRMYQNVFKTHHMIGSQRSVKLIYLITPKGFRTIKPVFPIKEYLNVTNACNTPREAELLTLKP